MKLADAVDVVRSKNSGPYELTFDLMFSAPEIYRQVKERRLIDAALAARLYHLDEDDVLGVYYFDAANAVKVTIKRVRAAGDPGETDVYGAQQHAPWLDLEIPDLRAETEG